jgi:anti-sigma factor RsiW
MKCEEASKELIGYLDRRANLAERNQVEQHLVECAGCRRRAEEFRGLSTVLEEMPMIEPSFGFDARVRQRVAAGHRPRWFAGLVPQPRLAFSLALLLVLSVWVAKLPQRNLVQTPTTTANESEQFQEIKDLGVLDNYDVLTKFDALSELNPTPVQPDNREQNHPAANGNGGA